jgi:hypothetical protein
LQSLSGESFRQDHQKSIDPCCCGEVVVGLGEALGNRLGAEDPFELFDERLAHGIKHTLITSIH